MAGTVTVSFVGADGNLRSVGAALDASILDAARMAGIEMEATCGARGRCRSCRVKILAGEVAPPTVQDTVQLGYDEVHERFRLACQTKLIAGCTVQPMPPKTESGHQILGGDVDVSDARLQLDSGITKHVITAKAPTSEHHQTSDAGEILASLPPGTEAHMPLEVLRKVPGALRKEKGRLTVTTFNSRIIDVESGDTSAHCYGMAFDIGTTSVVGVLMDLDSGAQLAAVGGLNPQAQYGGDLMSRIAYVQFDQAKLVTLRAKILNAINDYIKEACGKAGVAPEHVYKIVVVGNTCMHHIFLGVDITYVGLAPYAPVVADLLVYPARELPLKAAPNAQVCLLPIVAGFVGADTMACVLATRIYDSDQVRALVYIGTNGEVVMGSRGRLLACSAPAGPALEGAQIRHGMRGAVGAIDRVLVDDDLRLHTIGETAALGIFGSGLIDLLAGLLDAGVIDPTGLIQVESRDALPPGLRERVVMRGEERQVIVARPGEHGATRELVLTQDDVRQVQLAKGAIASGIAM